MFEIAVNGGHGNWTDVFGSGGILAVGQVSFEVGVSDNGELDSPYSSGCCGKS